MQAVKLSMKNSIKILGTGCEKCKSMTRIVHDVVNENKIDVSIEKVEDIMEIMKFDVMSTPALAVNGKVVISGRVPLKDELLTILNKARLKSDASRTRTSYL